jgi:tryptophanyl-tRNA synthetase
MNIGRMADGVIDGPRKTEKASKVEASQTLAPSGESTLAVEQKVTPWQVVGSVAEDGQELGINYDKLIQQFGTRRIDEELLKRFKEVTGHEPHRLLRRGTFFSHRRVDRITY